MMPYSHQLPVVNSGHQCESKIDKSPPCRIVTSNHTIILYLATVFPRRTSIATAGYSSPNAILQNRRVLPEQRQYSFMIRGFVYFQ